MVPPTVTGLTLNVEFSQGVTLGPLLFIIFINDSFFVVETSEI